MMPEHIPKEQIVVHSLHGTKLQFRPVEINHSAAPRGCLFRVFGVMMVKGSVGLNMGA